MDFDTLDKAKRLVVKIKGLEFAVSMLRKGAYHFHQMDALRFIDNIKYDTPIDIDIPVTQSELQIFIDVVLKNREKELKEARKEFEEL